MTYYFCKELNKKISPKKLPPDSCRFLWCVLALTFVSYSGTKTMYTGDKMGTQRGEKKLRLVVGLGTETLLEHKNHAKKFSSRDSEVLVRESNPTLVCKRHRYTILDVFNCWLLLIAIASLFSVPMNWPYWGSA